MSCAVMTSATVNTILSCAATALLNATLKDGCAHTELCHGIAS